MKYLSLFIVINLFFVFTTFFALWISDIIDPAKNLGTKIIALVISYLLALFIVILYVKKFINKK